MFRQVSILLLLILTPFLNTCILAQWDEKTTMGDNALEISGMGHQDDIQDIENRKLILMILSEDPKQIAKWRKAGDSTSIVAYRNSINSFNADFVNAIDSLWPFHSEYVLLDYDSIQHLDKLVKPEYAVIFFARYYVYIESGEVKSKSSYEINWEDGHIISPEQNSLSKSDYYTVMKIAKVEEFRRTPPVQVPVPHIIPTKTDLNFTISYAVWYMNQKMRGNDDNELRGVLDENATQLSKLTLIVNGRDLLDKNMDDPYIAEYPFAFNVLPGDMFEQLVLSHSSGYAYVIMNCGKVFVMRCEDGEPLYVMRPFDWSALVTFRQMSKDVAKLNKGK